MTYRDESRGGKTPKDARAKFAELLRRAERNGERIRLTRRGAPIAYIVPLADGERLKRFDEMAKRMSESGAAATGGGYAPPQPELPEMPQAPEQAGPSPYQETYPEHGNEDERTIAIGAFKKTINRILDENESITRPDMSRRIKHDGYIGSAVRKIIGEG